MPERVRTATRLAVGAALAGGALLGRFLDDVGAAAPSPLPALPPGSTGTTGSAGRSAGAGDTGEDTGGPGGAGPADVPVGVLDGAVAPAVPPTSPPPVRDGRDLTALAIGAVLEVEERAFGAAAGIARAAGRVTPSVAWVWNAPLLGPVRRRVTDELDRLENRGRTEQVLAGAQTAQAGGRALDGTIDTVLASARTTAVVEEALGTLLPPVFDAALPEVFDRLGGQPELIVPLVQSIVAEVLGPVLDTALPQVFERLEQDPDALLPVVEGLVGEVIDPVLQLALPKAIDYLNEDPDTIRSLVRDQSVGMVGEMADTVRVRTASADDVVNRVVARVLRRRVAELPPPADGALGEGS